MIITVTLNAAIDKTLAVPNFQIGRRHRSSEQRTMAGGKGVNVARALKTLGQPVIATGLAGGATGTRIIEQLTAEAILCDFVRIGEESRTSTAVIDPDLGRADRGQRDRARRSPRARSRSSATSSRTSPRAPTSACSPAACRAASTTRSTAELITELKRLGVTTVIDAEGEPMEQALRADARPGVAELGRGRAARRARVPRRLRPRLRASTSCASAGPREAIITHAEGCYALVGRDHERSLYELRIDPLEPVSAIGAGDAFLAGYLAARYTGRPHARRAALRASPAAPSRRCTSAPACSTRGRPSGSSTRSCSTELEKPRGRRHRLATLPAPCRESAPEIPRTVGTIERQLSPAARQPRAVSSSRDPRIA